MTYKIAVLPGDGIGPEAVKEAIKVLKTIEKKYNHKFEFNYGYIGGSAIDKCGSPLPEQTLEICNTSDAILLGSIGGPEWEHLPAEKTPEIGGLLALRKKMKLSINVRPVKVYKSLKDRCPLKDNIIDKGIDLITVRELSSGIYFGEPRELSSNYGLDTMTYKADEVENITKFAFELAMKRNKKVTNVDKANVLSSSKLWRSVVNEMHENYKSVNLEHLYVDNAAMQMILKPYDFDVILTTNIFGDILSDESAVLAGSLGLLPSASIGSKINLYEPSGGSAPDIAGQNIANPVAQILSAAMMLDYSFGLIKEAREIESAVEKIIEKGFVTKELSNNDQYISCSETGDGIVLEIEDKT